MLCFPNFESQLVHKCYASNTFICFFACYLINMASNMDNLITFTTSISVVNTSFSILRVQQLKVFSTKNSVLNFRLYQIQPKSCMHHDIFDKRHHNECICRCNCLLKFQGERQQFSVQVKFLLVCRVKRRKRERKSQREVKIFA